MSNRCEWGLVVMMSGKKAIAQAMNRVAHVRTAEQVQYEHYHEDALFPTNVQFRDHIGSYVAFVIRSVGKYLSRG